MFELRGKTVGVICRDDMGISALSSDGRPLFDSDPQKSPKITIRRRDGSTQSVPLASATDSRVADFRDGSYRGKTVTLGGYGDADLSVDISLGLSERDGDQVLAQIAQSSAGGDTLVDVSHFYRFSKPVSDGGHMVLPHSSGYLIAADCPDPLPGESGDRYNNIIGQRWSLPLFGMVKDDAAVCLIADTWWDCQVTEEHVPGGHSSVDFFWLNSLGSLSYPRRLLLRFAAQMDYAQMAGIYRRIAQGQGLVKTLEEKAEHTPVIRDYAQNVLLRWPAWNENDGPRVLDDLRLLQRHGLGASFFFPKWSSIGYTPQTSGMNSADAGWQSYLVENPVPDGWRTLADLAAQVRALGCPVQLMMCMKWHYENGARYDPQRYAQDPQGNVIREKLNDQWFGLGSCDMIERASMCLDNLSARGLDFDVLYFDGEAAFNGPPEDYSKAHPMSRRDNVQSQCGMFQLTRDRGAMPAAELARFWAIGDCDFYFYTDWSNDRLTNAPSQGSTAPVGTPIPLFELVFHECYLAGFSGGGYKNYSPGFDWWCDRTPRLYELLFAAAPAYNWLPNGDVPIPDHNDPAVGKRLAWLKRWSDYTRAVTFSQMISHRFLDSERTVHQVEFANGIGAQFDTAANRLRVEGIEGFTGDWEQPAHLEDY